jgi:hypothetical protein
MITTALTLIAITAGLLIHNLFHTTRAARRLAGGRDKQLPSNWLCNRN